MVRSVSNIVLCLALAAAAPLGGCATTRATSQLNYSDRARRAYEEAMELFNAGDMQEAGDAFRRVRREFGLSRWAWLAELRLADVEFRQEHYSQAITAYRSWIRYHPTQPEVPYAHFMIARCYFQEIPDEWALVPPSWERDQSSTHDAEEQFQHFLDDYPNSEYAPEARRYLARTRELLARHEIHVAQFYRSRGQHEAAISRLQDVLETYRGSGLEAEALLRIGETYLEMGRRPDAREAFQTLVRDFPRSGYVPSARRYLAFLGTSPSPPGARPPGVPAGAQPQAQQKESPARVPSPRGDGG